MWFVQCNEYGCFHMFLLAGVYVLQCLPIVPCAMKYMPLLHDTCSACFAQSAIWVSSYVVDLQGGHARRLAATNYLCTLCLDMARCSQHMLNFRAVIDLLDPCWCLQFALIALCVVNNRGLVYNQHGMFCVITLHLGAPKGEPGWGGGWGGPCQHIHQYI